MASFTINLHTDELTPLRAKVTQVTRTTWLTVSSGEGSAEAGLTVFATPTQLLELADRIRDGVYALALEDVDYAEAVGRG